MSIISFLTSDIDFCRERHGKIVQAFIWRLHSFLVYATMLLQIYKEGLCKLHEQKWLGQGYLPN